MANIENPGRVYGLSFIPPGMKEGRKTPPGIAFTVDRRIHELVIKTAREGEGVGREVCGEYLGVQEPFTPPVSEHFGFRKLLQFVSDEDGIRYILWFKPKLNARVAALNVHVLLRILMSLLANGAGEASNRKQLLEVWTRCTNEGFYGHGMGGNVFPELAKLLRVLGRRDRRGHLPPFIEEAMRSVWRVIAFPGAKKFASDCIGRIHRTGEFQLVCFGNACDVAIYPGEHASLDSGTPITLGCHNLDAAEQQLTLLAGLAALHQLADSRIRK